MPASSAKFAVGQVVHHKLFDYRGVIVDVDPVFALSDEWYESMALSRPPKDRPWYHVLRHGTALRTYVAERNLAPESSGEPVAHPEIEVFFRGFADGAYLPRSRGN